eukprot:TRINITY_DN5015_c0_g1_i1.p1 TRINITY_DN5015_c0_g1~~TRINITY_DN5015_c0_g1_i1.p1  ORF type:complete len:192 (+),score=66.85 TRINITY_DN5015_c0_g1_i1:100-675(+)
MPETIDCDSAIDIADSDEEPKVQPKAVPPADTASAAAAPKPLPKGPWDCPACGECNGEKRLKCNNCGKPRPGTEACSSSSSAAAATPNTAAAAAAAAPEEGGAERRRKRNRGWDDWDEQAKKASAAASAKHASVMKDMVNSWKPTVEQLKAMTVAELQPLCKSWKIHIEPKEFVRDIMLAKALKVMHSIET